MPRFPVSFAELHNPLFFNGNLGTKLSTQGSAARTGMRLQYDTDLALLIVEYQGKACVVPSSNIGSTTLVNPADIGIEVHSPGMTMNSAPHQANGPIIQPTAPARPITRQAAPMAPYVAPPQKRTAQASNPVRDAVNGRGTKLKSAPKYHPHNESELARAAKLAASGDIHAGKSAPTKADLQAEGKLPPDPSNVEGQ